MIIPTVYKWGRQSTVSIPTILIDIRTFTYRSHNCGSMHMLKITRLRRDYLSRKNDVAFQKFQKTVFFCILKNKNSSKCKTFRSFSVSVWFSLYYLWPITQATLAWWQNCKNTLIVVESSVAALLPMHNNDQHSNYSGANWSKTSRHYECRSILLIKKQKIE